MRILHFVRNNILFFITLFLLAFIPLSLALLAWVVLFLQRKVALKTPLTLPVFLFWIVGAIATLHGVLLLFPTLSDIFSNVAFLSMLRRVEYMSLFFIAFSAMKDKKFLPYVVVLLAVVLLLIVGYGIGQKLYGFPAYLTMNEEFAKGVPIQLSALSRVPSTFAGHYDLAAYLVLIIPLLTSMVFVLKNFILKISLLAVSSLGFALLFMTVSRVSFFVLLLSMILLLVLQKKRWLIICLFLIVVAFLSFSPTLLSRFGSTVSEVDVLIDARTGGAIGHAKDVKASYFENKVILRESVSEDTDLASSSAIFPFSMVPDIATLVIEGNSPTGEDLPQGTAYVNLPLSPVVKRTGQFFYQKSEREKTESSQIYVYYGDYLIKRAKAYDLSFTTRFQGEWPRTIEAFKRNIFLGSGYGSVSLAVDNNYLRILGESGLLGFAAFASIFLVAFLYIRKAFSKLESPLARSFVLGFIAGTFGLILNAVLIDVFEASKIAFTYWLLMGVTLGLVRLYGGDRDVYYDLKKAIISPFAVAVYLFIIAWVLFSGIVNYYFVGDDFTWFRWVSDSAFKNGVVSYFTEANGFFYRPLAKLYFSLMHSAFWLNQTMYHLTSIILHFVVALLVFLISKKILKDYFLSIVSAALFLILSGHSEAIFWISSTGFLFNAVFALLGLLFFIYWKESGKRIYFIITLASITLGFLFHELGVIVPLLIIVYDIVFSEKPQKSFLRKNYLILAFPVLPYLALRLLAQSHWFSGDYNYSLLKLPFNIVGNSIGYLALAFFGPQSLPFYQAARTFLKGQGLFAIVASVIVIFIIVAFYRKVFIRMQRDDKKILSFGFLFFIISLLPFLGLGNIASRYSYLSSFGVVIILVFFVKKIFGFLVANSSRYIAIASIGILALVFFMTQLFQLQRIHTDWKVAGEKSKNFPSSLCYIHPHHPRADISRHYLVSLSDAAWLVFRDRPIRIYQTQSSQRAFSLNGDSVSGKVFKFDSEGGLREMRKTKSGEIHQVED